MKIGRHAFINTQYISDPQLITLGDDVALGGSVRIFAHYGGGGNLRIAPVVIERLKESIRGGQPMDLES